MCDFCEGRNQISDEYGEYAIRLEEITPLPAIDLNTGEEEKTASLPFYELFLFWDENTGENRGEIGAFKISFCPICGRKLEPSQQAMENQQFFMERLRQLREGR